MDGISIRSYAKINLSLDVLGINDIGYHDVSMVMQQIALHDDVLVRFIPQDKRRDINQGVNSEKIDIELSANKPYLPRDERNIAYKAAQLLIERYGDREDLKGGLVRIDIKKRIPVAAGLAGGSGNAAAVILALNNLWELRLPMEEMMEMGAVLGADVPFCIMGQAAANTTLDEYVRNSEFATCAALAEGTGTKLTPIKGLFAHLVLVKPSFSVSTKEVYQGVDEEMEKTENLLHPDNAEMIEALETGDKESVIKNMINLLELYTLKAYPRVAEVKEIMKRDTCADAILMSGSGPTVYGVYFEKAKATSAYLKVRNLSKEVYLTRTLY